MPRKQSIKQLNKNPPVQQKPQKSFNIPYFAHQLLNPKLYPLALGLPVGKPGLQEASQEIEHLLHPQSVVIGNADGEKNSRGKNNILVITKRGKKRKALTPSNRNLNKHLRVPGGRPAVAKRVTADLDSDDEMIVRMKQAKYLEKDIAQCLADQGRTKYNPKTIGTRWTRISKILAKKNDQMLDEELTDWYDGDDDALQQAIKKADAQVAKAKADADARKWRLVADHMKAIKPVTNFSQNACRNRHEALQAGTAKPTPESVTNPSAEVLQRIAVRKDKERQIREDAQRFRKAESGSIDKAIIEANLRGNGWTSKMDRRP